MTPARLDLTVYKGVEFGPVLMYAKDDAGNPVNLANWTAYAKTRQGNKPRYDLTPTITDPPNGEITIIQTHVQTAAMSSGNNDWDLILQNPSGQRFGPYLFGQFLIRQPITEV